MTDRLPSAGLPLRVLASDRHQSTLWIVSLLESGGYAVLRERTGQHALQRARATQPDVVIVDDHPPGMGGVEFCRVLRSDARISGSTPIYLLQEQPSREQRLAALRAGASECRSEER